jgi:hypothetical protein
MKIRGSTIPKVLMIQENKVKVVVETSILKRDKEAVDGDLTQHTQYVIDGKASRQTLDQISREGKVWVEFDDGTVGHALMELSTTRDLQDPELLARNLIQFQADLIVVEEEVFNHLKFNPVVFA